MHALCSLTTPKPMFHGTLGQAGGPSPTRPDMNSSKTDTLAAEDRQPGSMAMLLNRTCCVARTADNYTIPGAVRFGSTGPAGVRCRTDQ